MNLCSFSSSALVRSEYSKSMVSSCPSQGPLAGAGRTLAENRDNVNEHSGRISSSHSLVSDCGQLKQVVAEGSAMKIKSYEVTTLLVPEEDPLANMPEDPNRKRPLVTLRLRTDSGIEGIGLTFYGAALTGSLRVAVEELCALIVGYDPMRIEQVIARLRSGIGDSCGPGGIFTLALSAIDVALWDIKGKAFDQPLWKLLGGHRDRVATYASGSLRRGLTHAQADDR